MYNNLYAKLHINLSTRIIFKFIFFIKIYFELIEKFKRGKSLK